MTNVYYIIRIGYNEPLLKKLNKDTYEVVSPIQNGFKPNSNDTYEVLSPMQNVFKPDTNDTTDVIIIDEDHETNIQQSTNTNNSSFNMVYNFKIIL